MLKEAKVGRVKTRLGKEMGVLDATWWYRHQTKRICRRLKSRRWQLHLAVSPDFPIFSGPSLPPNVNVLRQGRGDLGEKMRRLLLTFPKGRVCLVGSDIPEVSEFHIKRAFKILGAHPWVFGPTRDGGFWLVGIRNTTVVPHSVFGCVRWSTNSTLADTLATFKVCEQVGFADLLKDVDYYCDLTEMLEDRL